MPFNLHLSLFLDLGLHLSIMYVYVSACITVVAISCISVYSQHWYL